MIERLATLFFEHGDVGHVALFLWAASTTAQALSLARDLGRATSRYEAFVMAIARLNAILAPHETSRPTHQHDDALNPAWANQHHPNQRQTSQQKERTDPW